MHVQVKAKAKSPFTGHTQGVSTIAQVLFDKSTTLNYGRIVAEMEQVLERLKPNQLKIRWDCDDLVFFDLDETRLALAYAEIPGGAGAQCLSVSVGPRNPSPVRVLAPAPHDPGYDQLCSRIVERLQSHYAAVAVLWHQTPKEVTADLIDHLTDCLPHSEKILPPIDGLLEPLWQTANAAEAKQPTTRLIGSFPENPDAGAHEPTSVATIAADRPITQLTGASNRQPPRKLVLAVSNLAPKSIAKPVTPAPHPVDLARLRDALYPTDQPVAQAPAPQRMSNAMRLSVHAMNATLIMVYMPLGAAVMTYSILKGEDMRLSSRIMTLTGLFLVFARSPLAHSVAAAVAGT